MSDCRYGVSPVNYPDPDPDPGLYICGPHFDLYQFLNRLPI